MTDATSDRSPVANVFVGGVIAAVAGYGMGLFATALPARFRIIGLMAIATGIASGMVAAAIARNIGMETRTAIVSLALVGALVAVPVYATTSIRAFAAAERNGTPEEGLAALVLEQAGDEVGGIPVKPTPRWLRWRVKSLGVFDAPWPLVIGLAEWAGCVIAACVTAWLASSGRTEPAQEAVS